MRIVLVGRAFALGKSLLLSSLHPVLSGMVNPTCTLWCAAARLAGDGALVAPVVLVTTLW
jgi:hypothetical protein